MLVKRTEKCDDLNYWVKCRYTNGKSYSVACLLSLFFGVFGVDRFYLGYPVIGLIKLCTFGMLGIGALADVLLILLQVFQKNQIFDRGSRLKLMYLACGTIRRIRFDNAILWISSELHVER